MVTLGYWLIGLTPVVCVAWIIWNHRKKAAARAASRSERLAELLGDSLKAGGGGKAAGGATPSEAVSMHAPEVVDRRLASVSQAPPGLTQPPEPTAAAAPVALPLYMVRASLLDVPRAQLYAALRRGLPQHVVLAQVSFAALLDVPPAVQGRAREQRQRALSQYVADTVVCSADMRVLAVVDVEASLDADARFKAECLKAAGVRYVRVDPARIAANADLQNLIIG